MNYTIVEKSPEDRSESDLWSVGIKWEDAAIEGNWYGLWGEFGWERRGEAWTRLVTIMMTDADSIVEGTTPGASFELN